MDTFLSNKTAFLVLLAVLHVSVIANARQCSGHASCPEDKPFCSEAGCVFECPKPFYINVSRCVENCSDWYVSDRHCIEICPAHQFVRDNLLSIGGKPYIEKQCVQSCDMNEYVFENTCVRACPLNHSFINNQYCTDQCPEQKRLLKRFSINTLIYHECVPSCYGLFVENAVCTQKCSANKSSFNFTCLEKCPETHHFRSEKKCIQACPKNTVYIENNECFQNCREAKPFYVDRNCSEVCPENFYITNRTGVVYCEEKCRPGEFTFKNTCLSSCADDGTRDYYLFYLNNTCTEECPMNFVYKNFKYFNPYKTGKCISACSEDEVVYNRTCVDICPINTFLNNATCVNECTVQFPLSCRVSKGQTCTSSGPHPGTMSHNMCVSKCADESFIFNNSCVNECPGLYLVSKQHCVSNCPNNNPVIRNETVSITKWTRCKYYCVSNWQLVSEQKHILKCGTSCPDGMLIYNFTCVSKCPESHPYIVNRTCQKENCDTDYMYRDSSGIICTEVCRDEDFIYNRTCVNSCPDNLYVTNKTCHETKCKTRYTYNTSSVTICTNDCSTFGFIHGHTCSPLCPFYVFNNTCVDECPKTFPLVMNQTTAINCTNENCEYPDKYKVCVDKCPNDLFQLNNQCLYNCPNATRFIYLNSCVEICPEESVLNEIGPGIECTKACPSQKLTFSKRCVNSCPKNTYNFHDSQCVLECPTSKPLGLKTGKWRCIEKCQDYKVFKDGTCINEYDCEDPYFAFNGKCIKTCPGGFYFLSSSGCSKIWQTSDIVAESVLLSAFALLVGLCRVTLKEYFIVVSMILFKVDESRKQLKSDDEENIEEDEQPLLIEFDDEA